MNRGSEYIIKAYLAIQNTWGTQEGELQNKKCGYVLKHKPVRKDSWYNVVVHWNVHIYSRQKCCVEDMCVKVHANSFLGFNSSETHFIFENPVKTCQNLHSVKTYCWIILNHSFVIQFFRWRIGEEIFLERMSNFPFASHPYKK